MENTINQRFAKIRDLLRVSQKDMATALDVRQATISDIERGRTDVNNKIILALNQKYSVSFEWIYTGKGDIFIRNDGAEMNHNFEPMMNPSIHTPKMGGDFGGRMGENDEKNIDDDLSGAIISALCGSYNKRNGTDFGYNSFPLLSSEFRVISNYVDFLQKMLVAEVRKELFAFAKNRYEATGSTSAEIPEELDEILDKYVKIYTILEESAEKGTSVINDLNGLIEMLRKKHNI